MGSGMTKIERGWVCLGLAWFLASPCAAQLLDSRDWKPETPAAETPPPPGSSETQGATQRPPPETPRPAPEAQRQVDPTTSEAANPPPGIAKPAPAARGPSASSTEERSRPLLILFLSLLGLGIALFAAERARSWITSNIAIGKALGALVLLLRLGGLALVLAIVFRLIPGAQDWILWTLLALAVVAGWSVRDLFADLVAGVVLAAERRIKKGVWVSGSGFQGTVEGRSLRATWLRDGQGHRLTVPNRSMVGTPMVYDSGADAEHEVVVRLEGYEDAGKVRLALTDAILSSPWVLAGATPVVLRDPADPVVWRVRTKLLEPRFSVHFEGELLERVEDLLRYQPAPNERETVPGETSGGA